MYVAFQIHHIMNIPNVSVIIPAYNVANYILDTVRSISNQTHPAHEIIIVDDCSTDSTPDLLKQNFNNLPSVKIIHNPVNRGLCASRNIGLKAVSQDCEYIMLLDADDLLAPRSIELLLDFLKNSDATFGMAFGHLVAIDELNRVKKNQPTIRIPDEISLRNIAEKNLIGCGSGALIKSHVFRNGLFFQESLRQENLEGCADWLFYLLVRSKYKIQYIDTPTVGYRITNGSMSSNRALMLRSLTRVQQLATKSTSVDLDDSFYRGYLNLSFLYTEQAVWNRNITELLAILNESKYHSINAFLAVLNHILTTVARGILRRVNGVKYNPDNAPNMGFYDYCAQNHRYYQTTIN